MTQNTENSIETTRVVGRPFPKGVSGNPGGRPRGLAAYVRENTDGGEEIVQLMMSVMRGDVIGGQVPRIRDRMDAATWLVDRAFGKAVAQVETKSMNVDMGLSDISTEELLELQVTRLKPAVDRFERRPESRGVSVICEISLCTIITPGRNQHD